jgi:hypothetical protein
MAKAIGLSMTASRGRGAPHREPAARPTADIPTGRTQRRRHAVGRNVTIGLGTLIIILILVALLF